MRSNGTGTSVELSSFVDRTCVLSTSASYNALEFKDFLRAHAFFLICPLGRATGLPQPGDNSATDVEVCHTRGPVLSFFRGIPGLSRKLDALIRFSARLLLTPHQWVERAWGFSQRVAADPHCPEAICNDALRYQVMAEQLLTGQPVSPHPIEGDQGLRGSTRSVILGRI
jgi:hypothetical protein